MKRDWRVNPKVFAETCKAEVNRWSDEFVVLSVKVVDRAFDEWVLEIRAVHRNETVGFAVPDIHISRAMLKYSNAMPIWNLLNRMLKEAHDHLRFRA